MTRISKTWTERSAFAALSSVIPSNLLSYTRLDRLFSGLSFAMRRLGSLTFE